MNHLTTTSRDTRDNNSQVSFMLNNEEANAHAEALRAGMIARRQARRLAVGDVVQYPSGNSGEVVAADAGVSVQTAHGRDWFSFRDADHILTKVVA